MSIEMKPIKRKTNPPRKVLHNIPPHNHFGSEEDSLLTVFYLRPEAAVRRVVDYFKKDKHVLRFNAYLSSSNEAETERKFVFNFWVTDNTLQIYEEAKKNSGRTSAKFMEKRKVKNAITGKYYNEKDFYVGASIYINKYIFNLYECDDKTMNYMIDNSDIFRDSDIVRIIERIRKEAHRFKSFNEFLTDIISKIDPSNKGNVSKEEILDGLAK